VGLVRATLNAEGPFTGAAVPSFGKTIFDYDAGSVGAEAYRHLAKEILNRLEKA
jgi:cellulose biosynthesis protein BcsQ